VLKTNKVTEKRRKRFHACNSRKELTLVLNARLRVSERGRGHAVKNEAKRGKFGEKKLELIVMMPWESSERYIELLVGISTAV